MRILCCCLSGRVVGEGVNWKSGGNRQMVGVRGEGDDTKARQRWGPVRWTEKWIRFT